MAGKFEKKKEKSPRKGGKVALIVLGVILGLIVLLVIAGVIYYNATLNKLNKVTVPKINYTTSATEYEEVTQPPTEAATEVTTEATTEATTEPTEPHVASREDYLNFLVVGQDYRQGEENHLADSMILCTINTYEKTMSVTSIFRDTQLQVGSRYTDTKGGSHTSGRVKVNMIYASGYSYGYGTADAMGWMNQVLYDNFGIEVDYNFELDFTAFCDAVNLIGGIDIEVTEAEADYLNGETNWVYRHVDPGVTHLDGYGALAYARMRKAEGDGDSDIKRTERQRKVVAAVLEQVKKKGASSIQKIANEVLPTISTSMTNSEITSVIATLLPILPDLEIKSSGTCPQSGAYWGAMVDIFGNGMTHSVLQFDPGTVKKHMRALTLGEGLVE